MPWNKKQPQILTDFSPTRPLAKSPTRPRPQINTESLRFIFDFSYSITNTLFNFKLSEKAITQSNAKIPPRDAEKTDHITDIQ